MGLRTIFSTVLKDCFTSQNGDYDPARVVGYGLVMLGAFQFMVLTTYMTFKDGKFDGMQFCAGLATIGSTLVAASAGVYIKRSTENTPK